MKFSIRKVILVVIVAVLLLSLCGLLLVGCADTDDAEREEKVVKSITLDTRNAKTDFFVGDEFSTLGLGIVVHYEDGSDSLKLANSEGVEILPPSLDSIGRKKVSVQYGGFMAEYSVNVSRFDGIELDISNVRIYYTVGDEFSTYGLSVSAKITTLNDLDEEVTSYKTLGALDYTVTSPDMTTAGEKTVTVTYLDKTADYTITVLLEEEKLLVGIEWNEKREYLVGSEFSVAPVRKYSDGSTEALNANEYTVSEVNMDTIGVKEVTLTYLADSSYNITFQIYCIPDVPWETNKLDFGYDQNGSGATLELFVTERSAADGWWGTEQNTKGWLLVKNADGTYEMYTYEFRLNSDVSSSPYPNGAPDGVSSRVPASGQQYGDNLVIEINGKTFVAFDNNLWHLIVIGWQ